MIGSGHGLTHQTATGTTATTTPVTTNRKLAGLPLTIFMGDRSESDKFMMEFKQWQLLNQEYIEIKQPYNWVLMALTYIKGSKVDD
jgi:hypothetical protein